MKHKGLLQVGFQGSQWDDFHKMLEFYSVKFFIGVVGRQSKFIFVQVLKTHHD